MKYKKLAEQEAEAIRRQRAKFAEDEKARLKKLEEEQRERDRLAEERLKAHLRKMRELEDKEKARMHQRKIIEDQWQIEDEKTRINREAELAAARKKRD